ncbi:MAG: hypothetical protein ACYCYM_14650, partial [Saccharofermentanales bacterium]
GAETAIAGTTAFANVAVLPAAALADNVQEIRISLLNGVAYTQLLNQVVLTYADVVIPPSGETFTDDCADLTKVATKSDGLEAFADHPETHQSVIGKPNGTPMNVTYSTAGKKITDFALSIQFYQGFLNLAAELEVGVRLYGSEDFQVVGIVAGAETAIAGTTAFANVAVLPAAALADNVQEIRISLLNGVAYTQMLNQVVLTYADAGAVATPTVGEATPTTAEATPTTAEATPTTAAPTATPTTAAPTPTSAPNETLFTDDFTTIDKMSSRSDGWELFENHAESGLSVIGKTNVSPQYVAYTSVGNTIKSLEISMQIYPGFFELLRDLEVSVRLAGSETFAIIPLVTGEQVAAGSPFAALAINTVDPLPENVEEVKITLLNDVLWTVMLNQVRLVYLGDYVAPTTAPTATPTTEATAAPTDGQVNSEPGSPETGDPVSGFSAIVLIAAIAAVAVLYKTKKATA